MKARVHYIAYVVYEVAAIVAPKRLTLSSGRRGWSNSKLQMVLVIHLLAIVFNAKFLMCATPGMSSDGQPQRVALPLKAQI